MPALVEPFQEGRDRFWRARLGSGREVLAERSDADHETIRQLGDLSSPHLVRLLGVAKGEGQTWLLWELGGAVPLSRLLGRYSFTPGQATAVLTAVLAGLADLQSERRQHGALEPAHVLVGGDGAVRLTGFPTGGGSAEADVKAAGALACSLLGVPAQPGQRLRQAESWAPALVVEARAIAAGRLGGDAALALALIRDSAGRLAAPEQLDLHRRELGGMARQAGGAAAAAVQTVLPLSGRRSPRPPVREPAAAPAPGPQPLPPPAPVADPPRAAAIVPARPGQHSAWAAPRHGAIERRWGPALLVFVLGLGLVLFSLLWLVGLAHRSAAVLTPSRHAAVGAARAPTAAPAAAVPTGAPTAAPTAAGLPRSAGDVQSVVLAPQSQCSPGGACSVRVDIHLNPLPAAQPVSYVFQVKDRCTGATSQAPGSTISASQGWNYAYGVSQLTLPAARSLEVTAVTTAPAQAASPPLDVGGSC